MIIDDTIAAPATSMNAPAAIGIIRITGPASADILISIAADSGAGPLFKGGRHFIKPRYMYHGFIVECAAECNAGKCNFIDEVMICFYAAPASYTGEDMAEIFCHGGSYNMSKVFRAVLDAGARAADPGEFTKRACINAKIDLCQAEAVCDIINSRTGVFHDIAISQIKGSLSREVNSIKNDLVAVIADIEANLDFPEEDIAPVDIAAVRETLIRCRSRADSLLAGYEYGRIIKDGLKITIAGSPNVGKSSLFNLLLRENRAIVTEIPGTTRDVIEENVNIECVIFAISDTAGVRDALDTVEKIGIERTYANIDSADICLVVLDSSRRMAAEDIRLLTETENVRRIIVINKIDSKAHDFNVNHLSFKAGEKIIEISVRDNENIDSLKSEILRLSGLVSFNFRHNGGVIITNTRHASALKTALACFDDAVNSVSSGNPIDLLTIDIRSALSALGEIVGETVTDDILHKIFEKFCIGK